MQHPKIVWLRNDLRLTDHPALHAASSTGQPLIVLYVLDDHAPGKWKMGGASRWWLHHSLKSLRDDLHSLGGKLILRRGDTLKIIPEMAVELKSQGIYWNRGYEPYARRQEEQISKALEQQSIDVSTYNGNLLFEPWEISNKQGSYYKVFTQYWKCCKKMNEASEPLSKPSKIEFYKGKVISEDLKDWNLLPEKPNWAKGFEELWQPGEKHAIKNLDRFMEYAIADYDIKRDFPSEVGTSQLSPHLHFGEISPKMIWKALESMNLSHKSAAAQASIERYLTEIGWRDFSYYLLYHFPKLPDEPFNSRFAEFPWHENAEHLHAWQKGLTGYPIVDAGMRQLWHTGWMHNRVRMIVASFLTKDLLIPWQKGASWFWDTLVDADLANNSASWQWVAGCGADAAPYFRIFNPVLQSIKFDPTGEYIKKWVPELQHIPAKSIHSPWEIPELLLRAYGVELGKTYPYPIVNHAKARIDALEAFKNK
ncbi:MAG: deoxyribodipyrimidine photo-lyase [Parachlamydiaceae bacterium]|nr:deoxyribodipyrimidine photo-lyase [Parachlamydiaceae bacterium]